MKHYNTTFKQQLIIFGAVLVLTALAFAPSKSARAFGDSPFCASYGSGLCLSDQGNTGSDNDITVQNKHTGPNQNVVMGSTNACGGNGTVTSTCPFNTSALNNKFFGQPIVTIKFPDGNQVTCAAGGSGPEAVVLTAGCSSTGTNWVAAVTSSGGNTGFKMVNVVATGEQDNTAEYLDSFGTAGGDVLLDVSSQKTPSNWSF